MHAAGAAEFQHGAGPAAAVEQDGVDLGGGGLRLIEGALVLDVDHLHDLQRRQRTPDRGVGAGRYAVDDLQRGAGGDAGLLDQVVRSGGAAEEEGGDTRGCQRHQVARGLQVDDTRPARHRADEAQRVGAMAHGQRQRLGIGDAADLDPGAQRMIDHQMLGDGNGWPRPPGIASTRGLA